MLDARARLETALGPDVAARIAALFVARAPAHADALDALARSDRTDVAALARRAHEIACDAGALGFPDLVAVARALEAVARAGDRDHLEAACIAVRNRIAAALENLNAGAGAGAGDRAPAGPG